MTGSNPQGDSCEQSRSSGAGCGEFPADARDPGDGTPVGYWGKRVMDVCVSLTALVLMFPLLAVIWVLARLSLGSPVLFRQLRPGLHEVPFEILKFRSMTDEKDEDGSLRPDGERLTRLGAFLRKTSLDEFPELWNVLRGDLSLVGPRPLRMEYLPYYTLRERRRHLALPGITGLAQVSGRNLLSWDERLELDVRYVESISLVNDLRILVKTIAVVLGSRGASPDSAEVGEPRFDWERQARGENGANG